MQEELKPCKCGGSALWHTVPNDEYDCFEYWYECSKCCWQTGLYQNLENADKEWNTRATEQEKKDEA